MPFVPLSSRSAMYEAQTGDVEVLLVTINHSSLSSPIRLSSDPTERFSVSPLIYGTTSQGIQYPFVLISAIIPDDQKGQPPRTAIVLDNIGVDMVELIRSFTSPATADLSVVRSSSPDFVTMQFNNLRIVKASYDAGTVTLDLSREPFFSEPFCNRQTKNFFPGLFGLPAA